MPRRCSAPESRPSTRSAAAGQCPVVAILGISGLGHLGVQFANKLGFRTVAITRGADKEAFARKLGAHYFIDDSTQDVAAALNRLGGARAVLATVTSAEAMTPAIDGLAARGRLVVVGVDAKPIQVSPLQLIGASRSVVGHTAGVSIDSEDTLAFSTLSGVRAMIEIPDGADDGLAVYFCARAHASFSKQRSSNFLVGRIPAAVAALKRHAPQRMRRSKIRL